MKKILLLEDDKKIAKALGIRLRAAGYDVWIEHDGSEGIKAALAYQPDLPEKLLAAIDHALDPDSPPSACSDSLNLVHS